MHIYIYIYIYTYIYIYITDNETTTVHSVTKVDSMEEFNDVEKSLEEQSEYAALVRLK